MENQPIHRSRLAKLENKRMVQQTIAIIVVTILFLIGFLMIGIPSLINLAITLGNAKTAPKFNLQEDKLAPLPPQFNPVTEATTEASLNMDGFAEAGTVVTLFQNSNKLTETTVDAQGNFSFLDIKLYDGENHFVATTTDTAGNQSAQSSPQTVNFDNKAPELTIDKPADGAKVYGVLEQLIDISGSTDPQTQVVLNDRHLVVTGDGSFSTKFELQDGDNKLTFTATDEAGNQTVKEISVNFSR